MCLRYVCPRTNQCTLHTIVSLSLSFDFFNFFFFLLPFIHYFSPSLHSPCSTTGLQVYVNDHYRRFFSYSAIVDDVNDSETYLTDTFEIVSFVARAKLICDVRKYENKRPKSFVHFCYWDMSNSKQSVNIIFTRKREK